MFDNDTVYITRIRETSTLCCVIQERRMKVEATASIPH